MAINYSLTAQYTKPGDKESEKKVYAKAQYSSIMTLHEFAEHIANHSSVFDRATIAGVLTTAVDCMREQLLLGRKVELGDMGAFYCSISSTGAESAEAFTSANIRKLRVNWQRSSYFQNLLEDATFNYVGTRANQSSARRGEKQDIDSTLGEGTGAGTGDGGSGTGDGGGGTGEGGDDGGDGQS